MTVAEVRKLSTLLEISQTLSSPVELRTSLMQVLELLEEQHDTVSGTITLLEEGTGELVIEAATGIT